MRFFPLILVVFAAGAPAAEPTAADIEKAVSTARGSWAVPGVAVAVVRPGRPPLLIAQGTKRLGHEDPVSPDTVFPLASCTKAFTAALVASLVDDGAMRWDDPVRKHLPAFALSDPAADKLVVMRDLFQHRTGLSGHDLLWYRAPWGPAEVVRRTAKLPLSEPFRTEFQYSSLPVTAAGLAVAKATGTPWEVLLRRRLCEPLGMKSVAFTTADAAKGNDRAVGHRVGAKGVEPTAEYVLREPDPAGSMLCSVRDLAPWLRLHLNDGKLGDEQLVSAENLAETRHPATTIRRISSVKATHPTATQVSYAMGWVVYDHRGKLVVAHGGVLDGFRALVMLAPDDGVGVAVLANLHDTRMNVALGHTLLELLLELQKGDWNAHYQKVTKAEADAKAAAKRDRDRQRNPAVPPTLTPKQLAGTYEHPAYGVGKLTAADGKLLWEWSSFKVPLEHWQGDVYRATAGYFADDLFAVRVARGQPLAVVQRGIAFTRK